MGYNIWNKACILYGPVTWGGPLHISWANWRLALSLVWAKSNHTYSLVLLHKWYCFTPLFPPQLFTALCGPLPQHAVFPSLKPTTTKIPVNYKIINNNKKRKEEEDDIMVFQFKVSADFIYLFILQYLISIFVNFFLTKIGLCCNTDYLILSETWSS